MSSVYGYALTESMKEETVEDRAIAEDALREIDKLLEALAAANRHFAAEAEMNAALHLTDKVMPNPLAAKVGGAVRDGEIARNRIWLRLMGEQELPLDAPD